MEQVAVDINESRTVFVAANCVRIEKLVVKVRPAIVFGLVRVSERKRLSLSFLGLRRQGARDGNVAATNTPAKAHAKAAVNTRPKRHGSPIRPQRSLRRWRHRRRSYGRVQRLASAVSLRAEILSE